MAETYTREELERGEGLYIDRWTTVWQVGPDKYITCGDNERPHAALELVAGGMVHSSSFKVTLNWD